jgi:hypothetical protein
MSGLSMRIPADKATVGSGAAEQNLEGFEFSGSSGDSGREMLVRCVTSPDARGGKIEEALHG